jgi:hypothetical protein
MTAPPAAFQQVVQVSASSASGAVATSAARPGAVTPPSSPGAPNGMLGGSASAVATGLSIGGVAGCLIFLLVWLVPRLSRRLRVPASPWQPVVFLSLLERPG